MSLSELEALAKATLVNPHGGYPYELYMPYITAATPQTILQMIALIRQMGEALEYVDKHWHGGMLGLHEDALNALKEFDK